MNFINSAHTLTIIIFLSQFSLSSTIYADATLHFKDSSNLSSNSSSNQSPNSSSKLNSNNSIYIKSGNIRFSDSSTKKGEYSIFDSNNHKLIHINPAHKAYMEIDENTIDKQMSGMKQQMDKMIQQMQQQMKDMPPEQRQMVEQMMGNLNTNSKLPAIPQTPNKQQLKTNKTDTIAGINCNVTDIMIDGIKTEELCIADENFFNISDDDKKTITQMKDFINVLSNKAKSFTGQSVMEQYDGVPIRTRNFDRMGRLVLETVLVSISTNTVSNDKIAIPTGYIKQSMQ